MSAEKVVLALWCAALMTPMLAIVMPGDRNKHMLTALRIAAVLMFGAFGTILLAIPGGIR